MRIAAQVILAYLAILILGSVWRVLPLGAAIPDVVALSAVYLGLTARSRVAPAVLGAVVIGYLADLLIGAPRGLIALTAGTICLAGHFVQGRLLVRGWLFTSVFSAMTAAVAGVTILAVRASLGIAGADLGRELLVLAISALLTGLIGPVMFRIYRMVDARFARTRRERDLALEGLIP